MLKNSRGFTFVEIMITLVVVSAGFSFIFKAFIVSLDRMRDMTNRLYACSVIDNQVLLIERSLKVHNTIPFDLNFAKVLDVGGRFIEFQQKMDVKEVEGFTEIYALDLSLEWIDTTGPRRMLRSAYISNFGYKDDNE